MTVDDCPQLGCQYPTVGMSIRRKHVFISDFLRGSSVKIGTIQRRVAWPLRKDDTHESRSVNNVCVCYLSGGFIALATPRLVSLSCSCLGSPSLCVFVLLIVLCCLCVMYTCLCFVAYHFVWYCLFLFGVGGFYSIGEI